MAQGRPCVAILLWGSGLSLCLGVWSQPLQFCIHATAALVHGRLLPNVCQHPILCQPSSLQPQCMAGCISACRWYSCCALPLQGKHHAAWQHCVPGPSSEGATFSAPHDCPTTKEKCRADCIMAGKPASLASLLPLFATQGRSLTAQCTYKRQQQDHSLSIAASMTYG